MSRPALSARLTVWASSTVLVVCLVVGAFGALVGAFGALVGGSASVVGQGAGGLGGVPSL